MAVTLCVGTQTDLTYETAIDLKSKALPRSTWERENWLQSISNGFVTEFNPLLNGARSELALTFPRYATC
jgi:hypothetical protein